MNMKGGVGKTTVAMHLAGASAAYRFTHGQVQRVLAIDYDPQFNLSQSLLPASTYFALEKANKTILAVLVENGQVLNPYKLQVPGQETPPAVTDVATRVLAYRNAGYLDLVPSTLDLMYVALGEAETSSKPIQNRFAAFITECRAHYDLVVIDCHPAGSLFTKTSLRNSDHVVIPVMAQRYAVRGIGLMMSFIEAKKPGTAGPTPHILFNCTSRTGISREETQIRADPKFAQYCMAHSLKKYSALSEPEGGKGFVWHSKKPYSTEALNNMLAVTEEFLKRVGVVAA
jgi:chromosome partitioning protein